MAKDDGKAKHDKLCDIMRNIFDESLKGKYDETFEKGLKKTEFINKCWECMCFFMSDEDLKKIVAAGCDDSEVNDDKNLQNSVARVY